MAVTIHDLTQKTATLSTSFSESMGDTDMSYGRGIQQARSPRCTCLAHLTSWSIWIQSLKQAS